MRHVGVFHVFTRGVSTLHFKGQQSSHFFQKDDNKPLSHVFREAVLPPIAFHTYVQFSSGSSKLLILPDFLSLSLYDFVLLRLAM